VLAGGVALNCVANGKILREGIFDDLWVQPAAGDAGGALGAALFVHHQLCDGPRVVDNRRDLQHATLLGPGFSVDEIERFLTANGIQATCFEDPDALVDRVAGILGEQNVVGWFQGRMEYGPRALGARSILGDPRSREMQTKMNLKIKFRESFRPFAPSVMAEKAREFFELDHRSPYMLVVADVAESKLIPADTDGARGLDKLKIVRSEIPAITHVDCSARVQTVSAEDNPLYHALLRSFFEKTGCPLIVNTSFNVRGEPIVCSPEDAFRCFARTNMDYLVLGPYVIDKKNQDLPPVDDDWQQEFELD